MSLQNTSPEILKFGGTSMTDLDQVARVIGFHDPASPVVLSAPGKRFPEDRKVTDILIDYAETREECFRNEVEDRFEELSGQHMQPRAASHLMDELRTDLKRQSVPFVVSRGEYYGARVLGAKLGSLVFDAADLIFFASRSKIDAARTEQQLRQTIGGFAGQALIPGFYGVDKHGWTRLLKRGGSDQTGAWVARSLNKTYYNYTDVSGVYSAPPKSVPTAQPLDLITRRELRENDNGGSGVVMGGTVVDLRGSLVQVIVKNTFAPEEPGTMVVPELEEPRERPVIAVTGRKDVLQLRVEDYGMAEEKGYLEKLLSVLRKEGISIEHIPSTKDSFAVTTHENGEPAKVADAMAIALGKIRASRSDAEVTLAERGVVYVVGEGLVDPMASSEVLHRSLGNLIANGIAAHSEVTNEGSPSLALILKREDVDTAMQLIHATEVEGN